MIRSVEPNSRGCWNKRHQIKITEYDYRLWLQIMVTDYSSRLQLITAYNYRLELRVAITCMLQLHVAIADYRLLLQITITDYNCSLQLQLQLQLLVADYSYRLKSLLYVSCVTVIDYNYILQLQITISYYGYILRLHISVTYCDFQLQIIITVPNSCLLDCLMLAFMFIESIAVLGPIRFRFAIVIYVPCETVDVVSVEFEIQEGSGEHKSQ